MQMLGLTFLTLALMAGLGFALLARTPYGMRLFALGSLLTWLLGFLPTLLASLALGVPRPPVRLEPPLTHGIAPAGLVVILSSATLAAAWAARSRAPSLRAAAATLGACFLLVALLTPRLSCALPTTFQTGLTPYCA